MLFSVRTVAKLVADMEQADKQVISTMDPLAAKIMHGKKWASFETLITKHKDWFHDTSLLQDIKHGFMITGVQAYCNCFTFCPMLPEISVEQLRRVSMENNLAMTSRVKSSGDPELDAELWKAVTAELSEGWLVGPFQKIEDIPMTNDSVPHVSRRFPIRQGHKVRLIDDMLYSFINSTFGYHDKLLLMDTDYIFYVCRMIEKVFNEPGYIT